MIWLTIIIQHYRIWLTNMLHYNVRKSHCYPIRPGTRVHYVGRRRCAGGVKVAARTQLEVDRQIVQNMYRRRNEQLVEAKSIYFTRLKRVRTIQRPYSDWLGIWRGIVETRSSQFILVKENWQTISAPFHQQNIEHKERTRIDRYTYRRFGDKLFFWSSTIYLYGCYWSRDMEYN